MKVYVPASNPDIVVVVPVPEVTVPSGLKVNVQVPVAGNPFNTTLPVAMVQVGWVIVPIAGAVGVIGVTLMTTFADVVEVHPEAFVTVKLYVPDGMPVTVVLAPVPEVVVAPGVLVNVQVPDEGKPLNITLPVPTSQVG